MQKRIEMNRKITDLLCKLERKRTFTGQFQSAQDYVEWSLENANEWFNKYPNKELKRHVNL